MGSSITVNPKANVWNDRARKEAGAYTTEELSVHSFFTQFSILYSFSRFIQLKLERDVLLTDQIISMPPFL